MRHLKFDYYAASKSGENRHAQAVMRELGITYQNSTPQSICDQYWFWDCKNIPEKLPEYISELDADPEPWNKEKTGSEK
jgi:hypothetical protein